LHSDFLESEEQRIGSMSAMDHWQAVLLDRDLHDKPVSVQLCDRPLVIFRSSSGQTGVLDDICPHRRMKLSLGAICGERLQCSYHGWTFDCQGNGQSPGTPKMCYTKKATARNHERSPQRISILD
jgi:phenylpropionate dioxygenase-like ring-hydroxylating dioxygenase large terminal subunit